MDQAFAPDKTEVHVEICFKKLDHTKLFYLEVAQDPIKHDMEGFLTATRKKFIIDASIDEMCND